MQRKDRLCAAVERTLRRKSFELRLAVLLGADRIHWFAVECSPLPVLNVANLALGCTSRWTSAGALCPTSSVRIGRLVVNRARSADAAISFEATKIRRRRMVTGCLGCGRLRGCLFLGFKPKQYLKERSSKLSAIAFETPCAHCAIEFRLDRCGGFRAAFGRRDATRITTPSTVPVRCSRRTPRNPCVYIWCEREDSNLHTLAGTGT